MQSKKACEIARTFLGRMAFVRDRYDRNRLSLIAETMKASRYIVGIRNPNNFPTFAVVLGRGKTFEAALEQARVATRGPCPIEANPKLWKRIQSLSQP